MIGKLISHYRILEEIGRGGMGVVYKAEDTKLKRVVALKFLSAIALGGEEKNRFLREAQAAAALNHPNICTVHAIDEVDGQMFIAMEFIEGQSLREKIEAGPLKIEEAIKFAMQIADGLQAAHEKGITHRDIKSANVMITEKGQAKIMDFGLAKLARSGTMLTKEGMTLGTAAYMSPEQARGEMVDHRSDIWSLGVVLYEMISGRLPFRGEYEAAMMYSILNEEPEPLTSLRSNVPMDLEHVVAKALAKNPAERYQHADELPVDLKAVQTQSGTLSRFLATMAMPTSVQRSLQRRLLIFVGLIGILVGALVAGVAVWRLKPPNLLPASSHGRFEINLPPDAPVKILWDPSIAISPDGSRFVYVAHRDGVDQLFLRAIDQFEAKPIPGTENASSPFFSPDGNWVGYFDLEVRKLEKVSLQGGASITICDIPRASRGASWGSDDMIVFAAFRRGLFRVSAAGGTSQAVTTLDPEVGENFHTFPHLLPGGKEVLFTLATSHIESFDDARLEIVSLKTGQRKTLLEGGSHAYYLPTGHIVYARAGVLMAAPFDLKRLELTGSPFEVLKGVVTSDLNGEAQFSFSRDGTLIYVPGGPEFYYSKLVWINRKGEVRPFPLSSRIFGMIRFAPDGKRLAVHIEAGTAQIWLYELKRGTLTRLTDEWDNQSPVWTPDGERVIFNKSIPGRPGLFWQLAGGSAPAEQIHLAEGGLSGRGWPTSMSPDGRFLAYTQSHPSNREDIWILPIEGKPTPSLFIGTRFNEHDPMFLPDGKWIAYISDETGRYEVYVQPFPGPGKRWQISTAGGMSPLWAPNGRELFYRNGNKMMVVAVHTEPAFSAEKPKLLFENASLVQSWEGWTEFDITRDGQQFVMIQKGEHSTPPTKLHVILNWFEEIKRKAAARN